MLWKHKSRQKFAFVPQQVVMPTLWTELSTPVYKYRKNPPRSQEKNQTTTKQGTLKIFRKCQYRKHMIWIACAWVLLSNNLDKHIIKFEDRNYRINAAVT